MYLCSVIVKNFNMVRIEELSIGNWVLDNKTTSYPMYVSSLYDDGDVYLDFPGNEGDVWECKSEDVMPIIITEKFLLDNGFEKYTQYPFLKCTAYSAVVFDFSLNMHIENNNDTYVLAVRNKEDHLLWVGNLKYVHQLQNIMSMYGIKFNVII